MSKYRKAGVDIAAAGTLKKVFKAAVEATYTEEVLSKVGSFGGLFSLEKIKKQSQHPVLCASIDGVGTKVRIAQLTGNFRGLGHDLVNHSLNDILVQGAEPLFFLDYLAFGKLDPRAAQEIVAGMSEACRKAKCALIKGETAEMPGIYLPQGFDVAGAIVGVVDRQEILPRPDVVEGDLLLGLPSSGPHTNGYSLIRRIFKPEEYSQKFEELGGTVLGEVLLEPHRSYLEEIQKLKAKIKIKALAHITGGGFAGNIPRVLPKGRNFALDKNAWEVPPIFRLIQRRGKVGKEEMDQVFNMGIGMVVIIAKEDFRVAQKALPEARGIGVIV